MLHSTISKSNKKKLFFVNPMVGEFFLKKSACAQKSETKIVDKNILGKIPVKMCKYICCCRCRCRCFFFLAFIRIIFNSHGAFWTIFGLPSECVAFCCCFYLSSCILVFFFVWGKIPAIIHITKEREREKRAEKSYESVKLGVCARVRRPYDFSNNLHDSFFSILKRVEFFFQVFFSLSFEV